ncbi:hypothetical protein [Chamaesiphon polymorphus]|uniref:hypothetical protein n=1 Tax=Chamaesiphon polymorphus TaxID=2107691 RepID=UPI0011B25787|nr:hypothetical protein [Chamaesiphon polymorphus]
MEIISIIILATTVTIATIYTWVNCGNCAQTRSISIDEISIVLATIEAELDEMASNTKSGLKNLLTSALTPNPSPKLGRGEPEPQAMAG